MSESENPPHIPEQVTLDSLLPSYEQEFSDEITALTNLPFWQEDKPPQALFIDTKEASYGKLFDTEKLELIANIHLKATGDEQYPSVIIRSDEYYKSRLDIMQILEAMQPRIVDNGRVIVLEKPGQDIEVEKRLRILKERGYNNLGVSFSDHFTVWEGEKLPPTDEKTSPTSPEDQLELNTLHSIPDEVKRRPLFQQLPTGDILIVDPENLEQGTIFNKKDLTKPVGSFDLNSPSARLFSSIIFVSKHPLTSDLIDNDAFRKYAERLKKHKTKKDSTGRRTEGEKCGSIFIYEEKGDDKERDWRIDMLSQAGLVEANILKGRSSKNPIIWEARVRKDAEHAGINLEEISKNKDFDYVVSYRERGNTEILLDNKDVKKIDDTRIMNRIRNSKFVPRDLYDLKNGLDRDIEFYCGCIWEVYGNGTKRPQRICQDENCGHKLPPNAKQTFDILDRETQFTQPTDASGKVAEQHSKREYAHRPGDKEELKTFCGDCGSPMERNYFAVEKDYGELLISEDICSNPNHAKKTAINNHYVRMLRRFTQNPPRNNTK